MALKSQLAGSPAAALDSAVALAVQKAADVASKSAQSAKASSAEALRKASARSGGSGQAAPPPSTEKFAEMTRQVAALNAQLLQASNTVLEQQRALDEQSALLVGEVENI